MPVSASLRKAERHAAGVVVLEDAATNDKNSPAYQNGAYLDMIGDVMLCRTVYGGTKAMRAARTDHLPQGPKEEDDEYETRLKRAVLYPAFKRTARGLVGMIFRKDPILSEDMDATLVEHTANIDLTGRSLAVFARDVGEDAMIDGHSWILVEHPKVDIATLRHRGDERPFRPYWVGIKKQDVPNWQYEMLDGRPVLTLFVYHSSEAVPDGEFGEGIREVARVLRPGMWQEWEYMVDPPRYEMVAEGPTSLDYIPAVPVYTDRTAPYESCPPLLDLAHMNVNHWQTYSDRQFTLKFAGSPMPYFTGTEKADVEWGANRALFIPDAEAKAGVLESSGNSLPEQRLELKDIESRMASLGLQKLVAETRAAETAEAKSIDKAESDSALAVMAGMVEGALNEAGRIHGEYIGKEWTPVEINKDYRNHEISPQKMMALLAMVEAGRLPVADMWLALQRGEILEEDYDHELALESLEVPEPPL